MNTLERYLGKSILGMIFLTLFTLVGLGAIIKFVEQFRFVGSGGYDILQAVMFTLFTIPKDVETFFPIAALLGTLIALGNLASRSELIVMQSAGFSRFRIGLAVMKTTIPLVLLTMLIGEWGVPQTEQFARDMRSKALSGGTVMSVQNSVWAKDGNTFVFVRRIADDISLNDVYVYRFNDKHQLESMKHANQAVFDSENQQWLLKQVNESHLSEEQIVTTNVVSENWKTTLTPDKLGVASLRPTSLSISGLSNYISFLKQSGQDAKGFELIYWRKLFQPVSVSIMMLLALSFIFGPLRSVTAGARILVGILAGFAFYVSNELLGKFSLVFSVSPIVGALLPSLLFLGIVWWLLARKRD